MTKNNAALAALTPEHILAISNASVRRDGSFDSDSFAREIELELSKLRAPVAPGDERTAFEHHARACDLTRDEDEPDEYRNSHVQEYWNGWKARAALASAPVAMIDTAKLAQLLDSVNGDCYLGKEKEEDLVQSLRSQLRARVAEPEWIDDPHDIEQGMMRNPKYVAPGHKPVDTSSGHSAPVAGEEGHDAK